MSRIHYSMLLVLACQSLMPYGILSVSIAVFAVSVFIIGRLNHVIIDTKNIKYLFGQIMFYLILVFSLMYSNNPNKGIDTIARAAPLLIFPLVSVNSFKIENGKFNKVLMIYVLSSTLLSAYLCSYLLINYDLNYVFSGSLIYHVVKSDKLLLDVHPTLTSIHFVLAALFSFYLLKNLKLNALLRTGVIIINLTLFLGVLILSSKYALIAYIFVLIFFLGYYFRNTSASKLVYVVVIMLFFVVILQSETVINKFTQFWVSVSNFGDVDISSSTDIRIHILRCANSLIYQKPFFGYGVGEELVVLEKCLQSHAIHGIVGTHNYFLRLWISAGPLCTLAFLYSIYVNYKINSGSSHNVVFNYLTIVFVGVMLVEDYLSRAYGISLYAFLVHLFYLKSGFAKSK
ncbi:O-antigen ligase family protein [Flagellimonas sp.]|uniref:O-antigen ligase family protein n=1 Tax=Flagellimonas sp. TaxID=2058762 RepID=UPI003B50C058